MEVEKEKWKDIPGYENLYQISSMGRVKSLERKVKCKNGYRTVSEKILKPNKHRNDYLIVALSKEGIKKFILIHRLVADAFIDNPYNLPQVNHKNEIKTDNRVENLEFCDNRYNINYGTHNERMAKTKTGVYNTKCSKAVMCIETGKIYPSTMEIQRQFGFKSSRISQCCNKKYGFKTVGGYHWRYVD